jgi:hypothetical protein
MKIGHSLFTIFEYSLRFSRALPFARVTDHVKYYFTASTPTLTLKLLICIACCPVQFSAGYSFNLTFGMSVIRRYLVTVLLLKSSLYVHPVSLKVLFTLLYFTVMAMYKVVQIWPGQTVTCLHTNSPGHIWTTLYIELQPCNQSSWISALLLSSG